MHKYVTLLLNFQPPQMMKMEAVDRRFERRLHNEGRAPVNLQRKLVETKRATHNTKQEPDLTDFMNDMFFGAANVTEQKKSYNLTGGGGRTLGDRDEEDFDSSTRSVSSLMTQEWLEEAKKMVASSPTRGGDSPSKLVVTPRFAVSQGRISTSSLEKRDPLSRSARRHRTPDGFTGEILSRTTRHTRTGSDTILDPPQPDPSSPTSEIQKWISNNLKFPNSPDPITSPDPTPPSPTNYLGAPPLPPRQSMHRRSRFQTDPRSPQSQPIPAPTNPPATSFSKRTFKNTTTGTKNNAPSTSLESELLSPPKNLIEFSPRRSISSSKSEAGLLSPPRNLVESAHRRSISSSTCRVERTTLPVDDRQLKNEGFRRQDFTVFLKDKEFNDFLKQQRVQIENEPVDDRQLKNEGFRRQDFTVFLKDKEFNDFLKQQRVQIEKLLNGEINGKAKIVLSGPSNSTSSMVAATCYAWLLENKSRANKKEGSRNDTNTEIIVPVMNIRRGKMWKQRQAAWLFHDAGLDASSLLFSNEVELETLMMAKQLSMLVVGEDILKTNGEVGSACTILTDNYCEDAYDLLQTPILKKLMMAGILLDTQNLSPSPKMSLTRDAEAVQLLSVASPPNYRNTLFDQLMQDHREDKFFEDMCTTYGKPPSDINWENGASKDRRVSEKASSNVAQIDDKKQNTTNDARVKKVSPISGKPTPSPVQTPAKEPAKPSGKNKNFFAKLFGFGSK